MIKILEKLTAPRQEDEDKRRGEENLNILLVFSIAGFIIINLIRLADAIWGEGRGLPFWATLGMLAFFLILYYLNHRGWKRLSSWLTIAVFALPLIYCFLTWGCDLPAALLLAVIIIMLAGAILGTGALFGASITISIFLLSVSILNDFGLIAIDSSWRTIKHESADALTYTILLSIITALAWLFCRGLTRSLKRAHRSEELLQEERDSLEIKVEARTRELRELEAEKISRLYRFAEFGRLSSGIFHDLMNPLMAVSLNLENMNEAAKHPGVNQIVNARQSLEEALIASRRMGGLITSIRKQIARESSLKLFSPKEEISQIIRILGYKARKAGVEINFLPSSEGQLQGDPAKFGQIVANLVANAIEASEKQGNGRVTITLKEKDKKLALKVEDNGSGIKEEDQGHIFEAFFSTKSAAGQGLGLGLSSTKNMVEKDFKGTIAFQSEPGQGTNFTVYLPQDYTENS